MTATLCARIRGRLCVAGRRVNVLLASSGCAPHCTRRPAPGILPLGFCAGELYHGEDFEGQKIVILPPNLFILADLHFILAVLLIFLRQDESLDSLYLARSAKADAIMPFIP